MSEELPDEHTPSSLMVGTLQRRDRVTYVCVYGQMRGGPMWDIIFAGPFGTIGEALETVPAEEGGVYCGARIKRYNMDGTEEVLYAWTVTPYRDPVWKRQL